MNRIKVEGKEMVSGMDRIKVEGKDMVFGMDRIQVEGREMVSSFERIKVEGRILPGSSGSKSVDGDCSLKEKRKRLVRQYATEEHDEHESQNTNKIRSDNTVPYDPTRAKRGEYEGRKTSHRQSNPRGCSSSTSQDSRNTGQVRSSLNISDSLLQNVRRSSQDHYKPQSHHDLHNNTDNHESHDPHNHHEPYDHKDMADPGLVNNPSRGSISTSGSSRRTSNQSVLSISAYETHFPTYNKTISSIPPPASSRGDISNKQAGADIWEPRHSRSRTYQRTQSFRLHPGLVTLDTLDKEQHCCIIQ